MKKIPFSSTIKRARILFLLLLLLFFVTAIPGFGYLYKSGILVEKIITPLSDYFASFEDSREVETDFYPGQNDGTLKTNVQININSNDNIASPTSTPSQTKTPSTKACYRYMVTHLDGSTSNLCYSKSDYDLLVDYGYDYSSAKTFYEFQLDAAQDYKDQYDITGSDIYLDAMESAQLKADREKEKMNQAVLNMQQVEERGY